MENNTTIWTAQRPSGFALPVRGRLAVIAAAAITGGARRDQAHVPGTSVWRPPKS